MSSVRGIDALSRRWAGVLRARGTSISLCLCASRASRSNDDVTFSGTAAGAAAAEAGAAAAADAPAADADGAGLLIMKSMATYRLRLAVAASAARLACSSKPISHRFWSSRGSTAAGSPVAERSCSRSPVDDIPVGCTSPGAVCLRKREDGEEITKSLQTGRAVEGRVQASICSILAQATEQQRRG